ncbi:hypothetical protein NFI96_010426 [Prochilodus magdalenae]|nr:hypothetical protein NFI96_010426 [Prochilodus magdalenae]
MTENLYELNHLANDSNGAYSLQNSIAVMTSSYGISTNSIQSCPVSPHVNQKHVLSPATPQHELSPLLDVPHGGGSWDYNTLEKSTSSLWGSSSIDDMTETMGSRVVYPYSVVPHSNATLSSKYNASALQRLDSFSKAFPMKNPNTAFGNSVGDRSSEDSQVQEMLLSPQSGAPSDGSDRDPFSPVAQQHHNQPTYRPMDSHHNLYQNHQQYHYGYQQHKQQPGESHSEQVYKLPLYKSQSQYLQQQGIQISQNQPNPYSLQKQHQRGTFIPQSPLEGPESVGSPTYSYAEDYKAHEQSAFQSGQGLPLHSPHFKEPQHFHLFSHQSDIYQHQQPHEQAHAFSFKQNASFGDNNLASVDTLPGFTNMKEEVCVDLNHTHKRKDLCNSHYQSVGSGVNQNVQSTTLRGGAVHHLNSYRPQWAQVKSAVGVGECVEKREKKRYRHCLVPLIISQCKAGLESRGPVLFQSKLRSPSSCGDDVPYTPPPMLSPVRPGSGLFSSFNGGHHCTGAQSVQRVRLCKDSEVNGCNMTLGPEDKSSSMKPRINIGADFQAEIPDIQSQFKLAEDTHKASLLWTPCQLDTPGNQQRGSDKWTLQEKRQLNKALVVCNKDFHLIQRMVKTKSVSQCVEYYYTWKERLRLGKRLSTGPVTPSQERQGVLEEGNTVQQNQGAKNQTRGSQISDLSAKSSAAIVCEAPSSGPMFNGDEWNQSSLVGLYNLPNEYSRPKSAQQLVAGSVKSSPSNSTTSGETDSTLVFPCTECGKVFFKVKSRNAHMKTHRQQDDPQFWQLHRLPEQENQTVTPANHSVTPLQLPTTHSLPCSRGGDVNALLINNPDALQQADCLLQNQNLKE